MPSEPLAVRFPEAWPNLSFVLEIGDLQSDIDLDIELAVPQPNEKTEAIVHTMAMSLLATHRGAYADDIFDPSNSIVYLGPDVMDVSPNHIVWFIEVLRCNELALDGAHQPPRGCASELPRSGASSSAGWASQLIPSFEEEAGWSRRRLHIAQLPYCRRRREMDRSPKQGISSPSPVGDFGCARSDRISMLP